MLVVMLATSPAWANSVKLLLAVGNNGGDPDDVALRWAHSDAEHFAQVFREVGGLTADNSVVLLEQSATVVRARLTGLARQAETLTRSGHQVLMLIYISAHARDGELHLSGSRLALTEVKALAAATKAQLRLIVVDACDSGALIRSKGGTAGDSPLELEQSAVAGQVMLTSSGPAEASQEWESLQGALFTHHMLTGLRGDADLEGDGNVTLHEATSYAYRRTVANAGALGQHPTFDLELAGSGEVVLTQLAIARSQVTFQAPLEGRYVVASVPRADVVAEVEKEKGRLVQIALPAGRYQVRKRLGPDVGLISVELPYGGSAVVDEATMVVKPLTEITAKGGVLELQPSSVMLVSTLQNETLTDAGARVRLGAAYRLTWSDFWVSAAVTVGASSFRAVGLTTSETSAAAMLSAGYRWQFSPVTPFVGLSAETVSVWQRFVRDDEAQIARVFRLGPLTPRNTWGASVGPTAGIEVALPWRFFAQLSAQVLARYLPADNQPAWSVGLQGALGFWTAATAGLVLAAGGLTALMIWVTHGLGAAPEPR